MSNNQTNGQGDSKEQLNKQIEHFRLVIQEHNTRLNHLQSSAFQLGNFYLVFQGVILGAIVNSSKVFTCKDSWVLICLSLLAGFPNLAALFLIGQKYIETTSHRDACWISYDAVNAKLVRLQEPGSTTSSTSSRFATPNSTFSPPSSATSSTSSRFATPNSTFSPPASPPGQPSGIHGDYWRKLKLTGFLVGCLVFFSCVSTIMIVACTKILCRTRRM